MAKQGFYFNMDSCIGCKTCQIACKDKNDLDLGVVYRRLVDYEVGEYPSVAAFHHSATCNHCENPACVANCPQNAMYIDEEDGTVQHDDALCIGCETCVKSCPYGVPVYIESAKIVGKCDGCIQLRANGEQPACVASCLMRALEFGPIEDLIAAHPDAVKDITVLSDSSETNPCTIISPKAAALEPDPVQVEL